jgi:Zn-dependent protease
MADYEPRKDRSPAYEYRVEARPAAPQPRPKNLILPAEQMPETPAPAAAQPPQRPQPIGLGFNLLGIRTRINLSFLAVALILVYGRELPLGFVVTFIGVVVFSILWHELGHALAFKLQGFDPQIVLLWFIGLTYVVKPHRTQSPNERLITAAAGPLAGLFLAGLIYLLRGDVPDPGSRDLWSLLAFVNVVISLFNLLPAHPLDGGRIVHALADMIAPAYGARITSGVSLLAAGLGMWWAVSRDDDFTALFLLLIAGLHLTLIRMPKSDHKSALSP